MKRWKLVGWSLLGLLMVVIVAQTVFTKPARIDLEILAQAGRRLREGSEVYRLSDENEHTKPPLTTLLVLPLSFLPFFWMRSLWDALNLACAFWFGSEMRRYWGLSLASVVLGAFIALNPLNSDLFLGQFNLITLAAMWAAARSRSDARAGAFATIALLLKPTNLVLLPWAYAERANRGRFVAYVAASFATLALVYAMLFGPAALLNDHLTWARFLPESTAKHFLRDLNYGILSVFGDHWGRSVSRLSTPVLLAATAVVAWLTRRADRDLAFLAATVLAVVLTPMSWFQNFSILWPLFACAIGGKLGKSAWIWTGLAIAYVGLGLYNPELGRAFPRLHGAIRWPLWCTLVAAACFAMSVFTRRPQSKESAIAT